MRARLDDLWKKTIDTVKGVENFPDYGFAGLEDGIDGSDRIPAFFFIFADVLEDGKGKRSDEFFINPDPPDS
jgi:hypothetical protein